MRHFKLLFTAMLTLASSPTLAAEPAQIDIAHELLAGALTLPNVDLGTVIVQSCSSCATFRFQLTEQSYFRIGASTVNLALLRAEFAGRPDSLVLLELTNDRRSVKQIFISDPSSGQ